MKKNERMIVVRATLFSNFLSLEREYQDIPSLVSPFGWKIPNLNRISATLRYHLFKSLKAFVNA
jgi:hypothetical protein